ncbi:2'-5' RNA ligase [Pullulanibacillus pueri]|uniref:2'-5' RNA ligase family protein n=1 Tax=Pullulanibacillus pueri TaxID=1437324 RepID=A0A8J2ZUA1_9BACL|nr:2'-5' RNA ligase family protein [Pullulanibacillus pueri]MBM7681130.1 2'-5' RNA ligase [Pullulanibacillus pueri]GGH77161.1 hypothetical protein GCM10007096_08650 [Pullulanibacillus pueri]
MYGFIALFDQETENKIKQVWKKLKEEEISFYAEEVEDRRPHVTLASYNELNVDSFIGDAQEVYKNKAKFKILFHSLGTFLNSGLLFLAPTMTASLLEFHCNHHRGLTKYNDNPDSLYLPNSWAPHCTLANRLSPEKLKDAFLYCTQNLRPLQGEINEVALIQTIYENQKCVKAPIVFSKKLQ